MSIYPDDLWHGYSLGGHLLSRLVLGLRDSKVIYSDATGEVHTIDRDTFTEWAWIRQARLVARNPRYRNCGRTSPSDDSLPDAATAEQRENAHSAADALSGVHDAMRRQPEAVMA